MCLRIWRFFSCPLNSASAPERAHPVGGLSSRVALEPMANRPWFSLYDPSEDRFLARQIWSGKDEEQDQQLLLPFEMWLAIALQLSTFDGPSRLGQVCRCLRPICRHPELWERRSRAPRFSVNLRPPKKIHFFE